MQSSRPKGEIKGQTRAQGYIWEQCTKRSIENLHGTITEGDVTQGLYYMGGTQWNCKKSIPMAQVQEHLGVPIAAYRSGL